MKQWIITLFLSTTLGISLGLSEVRAQTDYEDMPAGIYQLDKSHAQLIWRVSHLGLSNYTARFTHFDATLNYDPNDPESSTLTATVNPASLKTDYPYPDKTDFDAELSEGENWFNVSKFPTISFKSTQMKKTGEKTGIITGELSFLGVTKPLTLNVVFNGAMAEQPFSKKPTLGFSATASLKRSDWGMSQYVPHIGDEVQLMIEAEFNKELESDKEE